MWRKPACRERECNQYQEMHSWTCKCQVLGSSPWNPGSCRTSELFSQFSRYSSQACEPCNFPFSFFCLTEFFSLYLNCIRLLFPSQRVLTNTDALFVKVGRQLYNHFVILSILSLMSRNILPKYVALPAQWPRSREPQSFGTRACCLLIQGSLEMLSVLLIADMLCSIHSIKQNLSLSSLWSYLKKLWSFHLFWFPWSLFYSLSSPAQHYEKV